MTPPGGSGVSRVILRQGERPAAADHHVAVLPGAGTPAGRRPRRRAAPGSAGAAGPTARDPRRRRSATGRPAGCWRIRRELPSEIRRVLRVAQVDREQVQPAHRHVRVRVDEAGHDAPAPRIEDPRCFGPGAPGHRHSTRRPAMRPPATASASASGCAGSPVQIFPDRRIRSADRGHAVEDPPTFFSASAARAAASRATGTR